MKKIVFTFLSLLFLCFFSLNAFALSNEDLTPPKDFTVYSENQKAVADILKIDEEALKNEVKNQGILFLAVNKDNSKQIKLSETVTDFSTTVGELSNLSNGSIEALLPDITGVEDIRGEIIVKDKQKYVKTSVKAQNGDYILTQYFTVANKKMQTLSFYTSLGADTRYIEETFDGKPDKNTYILLVVCICATVIFGAVCIALIATIVKDLIAHKKNLPE